MPAAASAVAILIRSEPGGPKSLRPGSDAPVTVMSLMVGSGQNIAIFTAQTLIPPDGATGEQVKEGTDF